MIYEKETWQSVAKEKKVDSYSAENNFRNFFKLQESSQICDHSQSVDAIDQVGFDCHGDNAKYPFSNSNLSLFQQHNGNFEQHNGNFNKQISYCNGPGSLLCSSSRRHNANLDSFLKMASLPFMTSNTRKVNDFPSWSLPKHRCNHSSVSTSDFETTATNEMSLRSRKGCMMMMEVPFSANANSKNRGKETTPNLSVCNKHCDAFRLQRDQELGEKLFFGDRKQILSRCNAEPLFSDPLLSNGFQNREFGFTETVLSCPIGTKQNIENLSSKSHCIQRNSFSSPPKRKKIFSPRRRKKLTRGSATRRTQRRRRKRVIHSRAKRNSALLAKVCFIVMVISYGNINSKLKFGLIQGFYSNLVIVF